MTHRRCIGVLVIGAVALLVAVVANLRPHLVPGAAQPAVVPGQPGVGDCVLNPLLDPPQVSTTFTATPRGTAPVYRVQQTHPCTGSRYGEVVAVVATPVPTVMKEDGTGSRYLQDPNMDSCNAWTRLLLGEATPPVYGLWSTDLLFTAAMSGPSARQEAAGQHWAACIVAPWAGSPSAGTPAIQQYQSSMRGALQTGRQRNHLGTCVLQIDWHGNFGPGDCGRPHSLEIFAHGASSDRRVNRSQLQLSCRQLVHQSTGIPDPTAGGTLTLQIHVEDKSGTVITAPQIPPHSNLICGVTPTGTRKLGSSLLGWGRQPIPWSKI